MKEYWNLVIEKGLIDIEIYVFYGYLKILIVNFYELKELIDLIVMGVIGLNVVECVLVGFIIFYVVNYVLCNVMVVK